MTGNRKHFFAITLFVLIIPVLTELLTANIPFPIFVNPVIFCLLIIIYSVPVLLIREFSVRRGMGFLGLFILGIAYGVFNEGVVARTILQTGGMLIPSHYDTFGFNVPWSLLILPFHAFCAVVYPIVLIHTLYPEEMGRRWLSSKMVFILGVITLVFGSFSFFSTDRFPESSPTYLIVCWVIIIFCCYIATRVSREPQLISQSVDISDAPKRYIFFGACFGLVQLLSYLWGGLQLPIIAHIILVGVPYVILYTKLKRKPTLRNMAISYFSLGHYGIFPILRLVFGILGISATPVDAIGALLVVIILFIFYKSISGIRMRNIS